MPSVYLFNPFTEGYLAEGKAFNPVKLQALLAADLANLPQFLCEPEDVVLVPKRPSDQFLRSLQKAGFAWPEFVEFTGYNSETLHRLGSRKIDRLRPWAWGPDSVALLGPLFASVSGDTRPPAQCFNEGIAQLYSKAWSATLLRSLLQRTPPMAAPGAAPARLAEPGDAMSSSASINKAPSHGHSSESSAEQPWLCGEREVGVVVDTVAAAVAAVDAIRKQGHARVVVKEALGAAGQNSLRLWEPEWLETQRRWIANAARHGRQLVVEPWLDREVDFSVQLEMERDGLRLCGFTGLTTDRKGQFQANWAEPDYAGQIPSAVAARFRESAGLKDGLQRLYDRIFSLLETRLRQANYLGPVGIDAFVYRTPEGQSRLKPIVEINPRFTMGRLTVELMKHAAPGSSGLFRLVNRATARAEGFADFAACAHSLLECRPLRLEGEPWPRIREGALCLNDPAEAQAYLAVFQVDRALDSRSGPQAVAD